MTQTNSTTWRPSGVVPFLMISYGGAWLTMIPLWLPGFCRISTEQGTSGLAAFCMLLMMLVPAMAAFALTVRGRGWRDTVRVLGLRRALPWRDEFRGMLIAVAIPLMLTAAGLAVATFVGWYVPGRPPGVAAITPLLLSALMSIPLYFGEELGWQGYLLPRMLRLGTGPGLVLCGVIWGLWHAPMTMLGGSYPGHPGWLALPAAVVTAVLLGTVIAIVRLYTGSVWAAVAAHLSLNEFALPLTREAAGGPVDPLLAGPLSVSTWLVIAAALIALVCRQVRSGAQGRAADRPRFGRRRPTR